MRTRRQQPSITGPSELLVLCIYSANRAFKRVYQPLPKELDVTYLNSCPGSFMAAGRGGASVLAPEENKDHPSWLMIIDYIREPSAPTSCAILFYSALLSLTPARLF